MGRWSKAKRPAPVVQSPPVVDIGKPISEANRWVFVVGTPLTVTDVRMGAERGTGPLSLDDIADIERGVYLFECRQKYLRDYLSSWARENPTVLAELATTENLKRGAGGIGSAASYTLSDEHRMALRALIDLYGECRDRLRRQGRDDSEALVESAGWRERAQLQGISRTAFDECKIVLVECGCVAIEGPIVLVLRD